MGTECCLLPLTCANELCLCMWILTNDPKGTHKWQVPHQLHEVGGGCFQLKLKCAGAAGSGICKRLAAGAAAASCSHVVWVQVQQVAAREKRRLVPVKVQHQAAMWCGAGAAVCSKGRRRLALVKVQHPADKQVCCRCSSLQPGKQKAGASCGCGARAAVCKRRSLCAQVQQWAGFSWNSLC